MNYSRAYQNPYYAQQQLHYPHSQQHKLPQTMESRSRSVLETMERLTMTCSSLARTLESTLMATHSGFAALLQLTHQCHNIKHSVGQVFGLLSFIRWAKNKFLGCKSTTATATRFSLREFESFSKKSNKTLWIVLLVLSLSVSLVLHASKQQPKTPEQLTTKEKKKTLPAVSPTVTTPKKLDFARALYSFHAESPSELTLQPNDLIAILSKQDSDWWQGRLKNGQVGYFPANHVEIIEKNIEISPKSVIAPSA